MSLSEYALGSRESARSSECVPTMTSGCPLGTYITCSFGVLFLSLTFDEVTGRGVVGVVGVVAGVRRDAEDE